jgi:hypothetical protein
MSLTPTSKVSGQLWSQSSLNVQMFTALLLWISNMRLRLISSISAIMSQLDIPESTKYSTVRGYGFLFRLENCFWTTQVRI